MRYRPSGAQYQFYGTIRKILKAKWYRKIFPRTRIAPEVRVFTDLHSIPQLRGGALPQVSDRRNWRAERFAFVRG
jgi:hypothetical protein